MAVGKLRGKFPFGSHFGEEFVKTVSIRAQLGLIWDSTKIYV